MSEEMIREEIPVNETEENAVNENSDKSGKKNHVEYGELHLFAPIRARSKDVTVLKYNFSKLTNKEYIEAMSADRGATNPFYLSPDQALRIFCAAAAHETDDIDTIDIIERMSVKDTIIAVQLASVFFAVTSRGVSPRTERG